MLESKGEMQPICISSYSQHLHIQGTNLRMHMSREGFSFDVFIFKVIYIYRGGFKLEHPQNKKQINTFLATCSLGSTH